MTSYSSPYDHSPKSRIHTWYHRGQSSKVPISLLDFLCIKLPHISRASWSDREIIGGLYLRGKPARLTENVDCGARVDYYEIPFSSEELANLYPTFRSEFIVYRDDDIAFVFKPAGLPTMAVREQSIYHLKRFVDHFFQRKTHFPSRLDTPVAGLIPVCLSSRMNRHCQKLFEKGLIKKSYIFVSRHSAPWTAKKNVCAIGKHREDPRLRVLDTSGEPAETRFRRAIRLSEEDSTENAAEYAYWASPVTGRTHQIRLHAAEEGIPILGDPLYGEDSQTSLQLHLCCFEISFFHPWQESELCVSVPVPLRPAWLGRIL